MVNLYDTGVWSVKRTRAHIQYTHTHTQMVQPTKPRSDVSHLMSTPLTSRTSNLHTHIHTLIHVSELLRSVQTRLKLSPSCSFFISLVNLIWFWFLTEWIENDKNVNFNLIYFPSWPWQHLYQVFCSGNMPGISSVCYPSFPIRQRPKVCAERAELPLSLGSIDSLRKLQHWRYHLLLETMQFWCTSE